MPPKPLSSETDPLYAAIESYVQDGTPFPRDKLDELAQNGRAKLRDLGRRGLDLANQDASDRHAKLQSFIDQHGRPSNHESTQRFSPYK